MNTKEFFNAVNLLVKEKGIDKEGVFEAMELALVSAYKKHFGTSNARIIIDEANNEMRVLSYLNVVEEIQDEDCEILLEDARKIVPNINIGETIEEEVDVKEFGRVAASTAKQVVIQKVREAERNVIIDEFADKENEMVTGSVEMEDERNYYINLGRTQGILPKTETIPGEIIKMGSTIKTYVTKVENNSKGPLILLSRNHYGFVKRLFELEIPEINEGIILVYGVAREAGNRTKIAVASENERVDAVGSCIGEKGMRIANILKELGNEKVDIVPYDKDSAKFIENALSPAKNLTVLVTDEKKGKL